MKTYYWYHLFFLFVVAIFPINSQELVSGRILTNDGQKTQAVSEARIQWLDDIKYTKSDSEGFFELIHRPNNAQIIISHPDFISDTLDVKSEHEILHFLLPKQNLGEVQLVQSKKSMMQSYVEIGNIVNIASDELLKAACCTLAESFETNPSIDSYYADAITGVRQIRMLGLNSNQILLSNENIPITRSISQPLEYSFIPGPQIENIQISKGVGSVVGTYESLGGEINVELNKPMTDHRLYVNLFQMLHGRFELNLSKAIRLNDGFYTSLYGHFNRHDKSLDHNDDGFIDNPLVEQINVFNRWQYLDLEKGFVILGSFRYVDDQKKAGQFGSNFDLNKPENQFWKSLINTHRFDGLIKFGYVNPQIPYRSTGLQLAYGYNHQNSFFSQRIFDIKHNSLYANVIYSSILFNTKTTFKTGLAFGVDTIDQKIIADETFGNTDISHIGSYFEVTHNNLNGTSVMAGIRMDVHSDFGFFITPRFNLRHQLFEETQLRLSVGSGRKTSFYMAENQQLFASNRKIIIDNDMGEFGKNMIWNVGGSLTQKIDLFGHDSRWIVDYYATNYRSQTIIDWETPGEVSFYKSPGKAKANSFQIQYHHIPSREIDVRLAYRYDDIKTSYHDGYKTLPLRPKHRLFFNLSWVSTPKFNGALWRTNLTMQHVGKQRLVKTSINSSESYSQSYQLFNAQLNRKINQQIEIYIGGENLGSFTQKSPIILADNPKDVLFDASQIYGPVFGLMSYIGLRWQL